MPSLASEGTRHTDIHTGLKGSTCKIQWAGHVCLLSALLYQRVSCSPKPWQGLQGAVAQCARTRQHRVQRRQAFAFPLAFWREAIR